MSNADYRKPGAKNRRSLKRRLMAKQGGLCARCRFSFKADALTFDHIVPQSKGGKWTFENLQLMCQPCNLAKGAA